MYPQPKETSRSHQRTNSGQALTGYWVSITNSLGNTVATGYTTAHFALPPGRYAVSVGDFGGEYFSHWSDGTTSRSHSVRITSSGHLSLTAIYCSSPSCSSGGSSGITVSAHRIPASYWAPCFALVCSAGTGPGASMYFVLYNSSGNIVGTGFADENGYTFTGLTPGATYYVYPADCDACHGSTHDVLFQYWGADTSSVRPMAATVGESLAAWYSCTNGCSGG